MTVASILAVRPDLIYGLRTKAPELVLRPSTVTS